METNNFVLKAYNLLRDKGIIHTQKDLANLLGISTGSMSRALAGDERYLTDSLKTKIAGLLYAGESAIPEEWVQEFPALDAPSMESIEIRYKLPQETMDKIKKAREQSGSPAPKATLPVIPIEAMAGTLGEFASSAAMYDCEMMVSPIKGADYAMKVSGDSMSPEYPNGSQILIKKVNEKAFIEWGKVYVLDTANGAVIKQIRKTDKDGVVECVSLNPDYQPFTIDTSFINGWYRVLMVLALK